MDATVRATCPNCRTVLRIPSQWVGQAVKCKKCGTVVRSKPKGDAAGTTEQAAYDATHQDGTPQPAAGDDFDFSKPSPDDDFFPLPEPAVPPDADDDGFDPTGGADVTSQQQQPPPGMIPGYPYPLPPGYPPPGAYGLPPGYPYAPPPGYPYPLPPGYPPPGAYAPPPGGYAPPPGYPYPLPPGYPAPGAYAPPPGYPYAAPPPGMAPAGMPPGAPPAGTPGAAPPGALTPIPPAVTVPTGAAVPARAAMPPKPAPVASPPASQRPATAPQPVPATPQPVPPSSEFKTDAPVAAGGRRYRRDDGKGKVVWLAVCLVLTGLLIGGAVLGVKFLSDNSGKEKKETDPVKLVERLGSADNAERDAAQKALHEMGAKAEAALRDGARSANPEVARRSHDLLAALGITVAQGGGSGSGPGTGKTGSNFPRRMLFVHISRYHFLNPLTAGLEGGEDRTKGSAIRLAYEWQVPYDPKDRDRSQLFVLSDTARPDDPKTGNIPSPMRNVVEGAYEQFFATSRQQDHIVFYFGGHALEVGGKAYLAPIEGDLEDPEPTLIPLSHFWEKIKACKATQRVVIWDVCRYNPQKGRQRPGSEPMTASLYKALADAPPGVEVIITCQPGENALEFSGLQVEAGARASTPSYAGSAFLESMKYVIAKSARQAGKQPTANDPIVIADWFQAVARRVAEMASVAPVTSDNPEAKGEKAKPLTQTLRVEGRGPPAWVAYDPAEPPAKRFDFQGPPKGVAHAEVASIVNEFSVPPIKADLIDADLAGLPYREEVLKDYKADVPTTEILKDPENYKFQAVTLKAFDKIRKLWAMTPGGAGGPQMRDSIPAPVNDKLKKDIVDEQDFWALGVAELEGVNSDLDGVAKLRDMQSKRWKANYDYACAVIKSRLAFMHEYNKVLGNVRTETLPELDLKRGQNMYKLVSAEKMKSGKDVVAIAEEAKTAYERVVTEHKGTPWALQAKREKAFRLGLAWQPISSGDPEMMK